MDNPPEIKAEADDSVASDNAYLNQLLAESKQLDPSLTACHQLLAQEIARVQSGQSKFIELHTDAPMRVAVDIRVPVKEYPEFNFVGKILGPKGNSLKRIQEETGTRVAVLGRGSVRDKNKEEELRKEGGKYAHLNEELHVHVEAFATPAECYFRLSQALDELRRHLEPDYNDDVSLSQIQELAYLNGKRSSFTRGRGSGFVGRGGSGRGRSVSGEIGTGAEYGLYAPGEAPIMRDASWNPALGRGRGRLPFTGSPLYNRDVLSFTGQSALLRPPAAGIIPGSYGNVPPRLRQH